MKLTYPIASLVATTLILGPVGWRVLSWERQPPLVVDAHLASAGEVLFNHEWEPNDPLCADGDGLGPVFNARSCVACHHQNRAGGGGSLEHNVTTYVLNSADGATQKQGIVHAFATSPEYQETLRNVDPSLPAVAQPTLAQVGLRPSTFGSFQIAQRNTPALFGAGLIDLIPEQAIVANERQERLRHGMIAAGSETVPVGRIFRVANGKIGRFGWKAQMASLSEFVQAACASELGLGNPTNAQPTSMSQLTYAPGGLDLTQKQCDQLTAFVAALPRPVERMPLAAPLQKQVHAGKALFTKIGCADCHTPNLGSVDGIYSDLLLHRMGVQLESASQGYYETRPTIPTDPGSVASPSTPPLPDEWRTPPLWGVADSAPYMHDGRAATLADAIRLHGGQGDASAKLFAGLVTAEQSKVLAFLHTLKAP